MREKLSCVIQIIILIITIVDLIFVAAKEDQYHLMCKFFIGNGTFSLHNWISFI